MLLPFLLYKGIAVYSVCQAFEKGHFLSVFRMSLVLILENKEIAMLFESFLSRIVDK
jgi:hypothetical protein